MRYLPRRLASDLASWLFLTILPAVSGLARALGFAVGGAFLPRYSCANPEIGHAQGSGIGAH
jgi:hypothetical protein